MTNQKQNNLRKHHLQKQTKSSRNRKGLKKTPTPKKPDPRPSLKEKGKQKETAQP